MLMDSMLMDRMLIDRLLMDRMLMDRMLADPMLMDPLAADAGAAGSNEDDLTVKLADIVKVNNIIRCASEGGKALVQHVMEDWEYLQCVSWSRTGTPRQLEPNRRPRVSWSRTGGPASAGAEPEAARQRRPRVSWSLALCAGCSVRSTFKGRMCRECVRSGSLRRNRYARSHNASRGSKAALGATSQVHSSWTLHSYSPHLIY